MKVMGEIVPSWWERFVANRKVKSVVNYLNNELSPELDIELGGSFAKNTWLSGDHDVDIFIKFPYEKYKDKDISGELYSNFNKVTVVHGSRDYFQLRKGNYVFELIPVLNVEDPKKAVNVTDMSPFHTIWIKNNLKHPDQVRLFKKFLKANGLYGAESFIRGFSGYAAELLITKYHFFFDLMKDAANWPERKYIDMEGHYTGALEAMKSLNKDRLSQLILVDPVNPERNAAAALSKEKYQKFIETAKAFIRNPSDDFFKWKSMNLSILNEKKQDNTLIYIEGIPVDGKRDIVGAKLLKTNEFLAREIESSGFNIIDYNWEFGDKVLFWYIVDSNPLSDNVKKYGPPVKDKANLKKFIERWEAFEVKEDQGRAYVVVPREIKTVKELVEQLVDEEHARYFKTFSVRYT